MKRYGTRATDTSTWRGGNCRAKQIVSIVATVIAVAAAFLFLLSFSISLPIINRWFYYIQIDTLHLEQASGHTYAEIKAAYDEILDYLLLPGRQFGAGVFRFSEEGAAHFADCKFLFVLDLVIAGVSFGVICGIVALHFTKIITLKNVAGHSFAFWSAIAAIVIPIILGGLISINFDRAFEIFHAVLFPGKDNWMFNPYTDEIITVMPEQFFMNCAVFIGAGLIFFSATAITADCLLQKKLSEKNIRARYR